MSTEHSIGESTGTTTEHTAMEDVVIEKGKGKAIQEHTEGEEDSSSDDDQGEEEEEESEDELAEIDTSNIIHSGRTRRKNIDWTAVSDEDAMDDDDDDDEYKAEDDSMKE